MKALTLSLISAVAFAAGCSQESDTASVKAAASTAPAALHVTCAGDFTGTGDYVEVTGDWRLSALDNAFVSLSTEYGIDDPEPYAMAHVASNNQTLAEAQTAERVIDLNTGEIATIDFSQVACFDLSKETAAADLTHLCLPVGVDGSSRKFSGLLVSDIVAGEGYMQALEVECQVGR
jgi:hypothetical protein